MSTGYVAQGGFVPAQALSKPKRSKKPVLIVAVIVVVLLLAVYLGGAFYFSSHFMPNTTFNDEDFSFASTETLVNEIQDRAASYTLTVAGEGFSYTFDNTQTAVSVDADTIATDAIEAQSPYSWPLGLLRSHEIADVAAASYDQAGMGDTLRAEVDAFNEGKSESVNATVVYDEATDDFVIEGEVYGEQIDADALIAKTELAAASLQTEVEVTEDELIKPTLLADDSRLTEALSKVRSMLPSPVSLMLNGSVQAAVIDKATFAAWIDLDPETCEPTVNQDRIASWIDEMAAGFNTVGTTRTWTREDGKVCTVSGGTWGWVVDTSSLSTTIHDALMAGSSATIDIPCTQSSTVYGGIGARDWAEYVDVDLTEQQVRYYDASGNCLYQCNCITGYPSSERTTPTGVYYLNAKQGETTLYTYEQGKEKPNETVVEYWMPFQGNAVGLHDAWWQNWSSWSATAYQSVGSHGCVNLSTSDAAWFYNNLTPGVCVITHY